jgi:hypothetical protein
VYFVNNTCGVNYGGYITTNAVPLGGIKVMGGNC